MLTPEESSSNSVVGEVAQRIKDLSDFGKVSYKGIFNYEKIFKQNEILLIAISF